MSSLLVIRVHRLEIQSVMLVFFSTQLCELLPLYLLSGFTVCGWEGVGGVVVLETIFSLWI